MTEEELANLKTMTAREWAAVSGIKLSRILRLTREGKGPQRWSGESRQVKRRR